MKSVEPAALLLLLLSLLGCGGCDTPLELAYASSVCDAVPLDLNVGNFNADSYDLPSGTCGVSVFEHQIRLPLPSTDSVYLQFENLEDRLFFRVYGVPIVGGAPEEVLGCQPSSAAYPSVAFSVEPDTYDHLVLVVTRNAPLGGLANGRLENTLSRVVAFQEKPKHYRRNGVAISCDGRRNQQLLIGSCNPNALVGAWASEQGLTVVDSLPFGPAFGAIVLVEVPPGIEANSEPPSPRTKIKDDTVNYFVEQDLTFRLSPADLRPLSTIAFDGNVPYIQDRVGFPDRFVGPGNCPSLRFDPDPGTASTGSLGDIMIAIVDSGVDTVTYPDLWTRHRYRGPDDKVFLAPDRLGYDFVDDDPTPNDRMGHGTAIAGSIIGGYRGSRPLNLVHYKIFDSGGVATYFGAVLAIYAAVSDGADIINLSWGIVMDDMPQSLRCAIDYADEQGVIVVTTAGNESADMDNAAQWPGAFAGIDTFGRVITTASYVIENNAPSLASFSNYGDNNVTLAAYATVEQPKFGSVGRDTLYGTSISAPLVTRELARIMSDLPPGDTSSITQLLSLLQAQLQPDQTQGGGRILPLQCTTVP